MSFWGDVNRRVIFGLIPVPMTVFIHWLWQWTWTDAMLATVIYALTSIEWELSKIRKKE